MADDLTTGRSPGKAPSPESLPQRSREAAAGVSREMKGIVHGGQEAKPADHVAAPHTPDVSGDGDSASQQARGITPNQAAPTFAQRLEGLRQALHESHTLEHVREPLEPGCP